MKKKKEKILIGRREYIDLPELNLYNIEAKIDTGAYSSALHCEYIQEEGNRLCIQVFQNSPKIDFDIFTKKVIKNSFGVKEDRYVIKTLMILGNRKIRIHLSLTNRSEMKYAVLLGRRAICGKCIVDVERKYILRQAGQ